MKVSASKSEDMGSRLDSATDSCLSPDMLLLSDAQFLDLQNSYLTASL